MSGAGESRAGRSRSVLGQGRFTRHRVFLVAFALAAGLRVVVMLGYPPVMWFNDSYDYVAVALYPHPNRIRPSGYAFALRSLLPFHDFALVAAVQHVAGLTVAAACYGLCRRLGLAGWAGTLVTVPVLFDAYQLQLEQVVMSDTLFVLLVMVAVVLLSRRARPGAPVCAVAGVSLGLAAITRTIGLPLLIPLAGYLLLRRAGWRAVAAALAAALLPIAAYGSWFHSMHGTYALTGADGVFLYGRTMAFADCARMRPPPELRTLCAAVPPGGRPASQMYIWDHRAPLNRRPGPRLAPEVNELAGGFAELAIRSQPWDYLTVVGRDTLRVFGWRRTPFPDRRTYLLYRFDRQVESPPRWAPQYLDRYDRGWRRTRAAEPYAGFLGGYQRHVYLRGTLLGVVLAIGAAGVVAARRSRGGPGVLPLMVSVTLIVAPAATAEFGYRYVLAAVPSGCLGAGLAFAAWRSRKDAMPQWCDRIPRRCEIP